MVFLVKGPIRKMAFVVNIWLLSKHFLGKMEKTIEGLVILVFLGKA